MDTYQNIRPVKRILPFSVLLALLFSVAANGDDELARANQQFANPLSTATMSIIENQSITVDGDLIDGHERYNVLIFDPLIPQKLNDKWTLVHRPILPIISSLNTPTGTPDNPDTISDSGIGDLIYWAAFSPETGSAFNWGIGPLIKLPTAGKDRLGEEKVSLGNVLVALYSSTKFSFGINNNNYFSVSGLGDDNRRSVNRSTVQYFWFYNFTPEWGIGSAPTITYDWSASSDENLELPIGIGVTRTFRIGKYPSRLLFEYEHFVESKDAVGSDWIFRVAWAVFLPLLK